MDESNEQQPKIEMAVEELALHARSGTLRPRQLIGYAPDGARVQAPFECRVTRIRVEAGGAFVLTLVPARRLLAASAGAR